MIFIYVKYKRINMEFNSDLQAYENSAVWYPYFIKFSLYKFSKLFLPPFVLWGLL